MSGAAAGFLATPLCGVALASAYVRNEVFAHAEAVNVKFTHLSTVATEAFLTVAVKCRQMTMLTCYGLTTLPERIVDCAALKTLDLSRCRDFRVIYERIGALQSQ